MRRLRWSSLCLLFALGCSGTLGESQAERVAGPDAGPISLSNVELCNSFDDNGDGEVDEGCPCSAGQTHPCFQGPASLAHREGPEGEPRLLGICAMGTQSCIGAAGSEFGGAWGSCENAVLPQEEICGDGIDQHCDGQDPPCPNRAPAAKDDQANAVAETTLTIDVLANDTDPDKDSLSVVETSQGLNGGTVSITKDGKKITYVLNTKFVDKDSFSYKTSDGKETSGATVNISLRPDCRFHLFWPHFYWGVHAEYSTIVGAVWNQQPGQGAACGNAAVSSCTAGAYLYERSTYTSDPLDRGRTEICRKKL